MSVSVIIPLFNKREYIDRAIDSVLRQTITDFELIVVDDGSTDAGGDVVRKYTDRRIQLIVQENAGVSAARNRGAVESHGNWIAFLDADDEWYPCFLERSLEFLTQHPTVHAVFSDLFLKKLGRRHNPPDAGGTGIVDDYFEMAVKCNGYPVSFCAVVLDRDVFWQSGGFPPGVAYGEDIDTFNRIVLHTQVGYISEPLVIYHNEVMGAEKEFNRLGYPYPMTVVTLRRIELRYLSNKHRQSIKNYIGFMLLAYANNQIAVGKIEKALSVLLLDICAMLPIWKRYFRCWKFLLTSCCPRKIRRCFRSLKNIVHAT
jgi:glycosyltransferase involved in cell wall biosynthesis